jgi:hypothetical protein
LFLSTRTADGGPGDPGFGSNGELEAGVFLDERLADMI